MGEKKNDLPTSEFRVIPGRGLVEVEITTGRIIATIKTGQSIRPDELDTDPTFGEDEYIQHRGNLQTTPNQN